MKKKNKFEISNKKSDICKFREKYLKKNIELVDITSLCELKLGQSGWCSGLNEPEDNIYHIQILYRKEIVATIGPDRGYTIDDNRYVLYVTEPDNITGADFILFKVCRMTPAEVKEWKKEAKIMGY